MRIHGSFPGGNVSCLGIEGDTVLLERQLRDTEGDWFYWAFAVEDACGRTVRFRFPAKDRVGRFGPAVSRDFSTWRFLGSKEVTEEGEGFSYTFGPDETCVWFAHHMLYPLPRLSALCERLGTELFPFCPTEGGRAVPAVSFGRGDKRVLLTARHHACESTGNYVLEGVLETLCASGREDLAILAVPFVDYEGVLAGDQGKNRRPHDHNRDYTDHPRYPVTRALKAAVAEDSSPLYYLDLHSPWHQGGENDRLFAVLPAGREEEYARFSRLLAEESRDLTPRYDGTSDVPAGERWNSATSPSSKNYFASLPFCRLSLTLETAYFGEEGAPVSQAQLVDYGRAVGRALLRQIDTDA